MSIEKDRNVCFHCGGKLNWQNDFDYEDYGLEGKGIVHVLQCGKCDAKVEYYVPDQADPEETDLEKALKYVQQFCKDTDCNECKYYHDGYNNTYGCEFRLTNPIHWKI